MKNNFTLLVALSGGLDSVVLLHFIKTCFPHQTIQAVHINHQLTPQAAEFEQHAQHICQKLNIKLDIIKINISRAPGESLEAQARLKRYEAFKNILQENDILLTAHHQTDQAETVLLQLLRGGGLRGVSAMPKVSSLGRGFLARPLLKFSRTALQAYADYYQLNWCEDQSNLNPQYDRNYLRHEIFPRLKKQWPQADKILSRFAAHCAEQEKLLSAIAQEDCEFCAGNIINLFPDINININTSEIIAVLDIKKLSRYLFSRQKNILRYWIKKHTLNMPTENILLQILAVLDFKKIKPDKNPVIKFLNFQFRRYQHNLYLLSAESIFLSRYSDLSALLPAEIDWCQKNGVDLNHKNIQLSFRKGGEKFKPRNAQHTRLLKNLFQEWQVPPWRRDKIPLIYLHQQLIAVVGYAIT